MGEHGRGILSDQNGTRIIGVWNCGVLTEELTEMIVPALEVDAIAGPEREQRVFVSMRSPDAPMQSSATEWTEPGKTLSIFTNGDRYIGSIADCKKHGEGMYVYADGSAY